MPSFVLLNQNTTPIIVAPTIKSLWEIQNLNLVSFASKFGNNLLLTKYLAPLWSQDIKAVKL